MTGVDSAVFLLQEWCAKRFQNLKYDLEELSDTEEVRYSCKLAVGKSTFTSKGEQFKLLICRKIAGCL